MGARAFRTIGLVLIGVGLLGGCQGKYERLPKASERDKEALTERYRALIQEAKTLKPEEGMNLLHHFSEATLTAMQPAEFQAAASKFIADAAAGKLDAVKIAGAREPGKVRLLLIELPASKGAIPFVQTADGWKIDDIAVAFGDHAKELNLKGNMPASPASSLASVAMLQNPQATSGDKVRAALALAGTKDQATAEKFAGKEKKGSWAKAALLYAAWKSGAACEPFAEAMPVVGEALDELYEDDSEAFRKLIAGLTECASTSASHGAAVAVYKGCHAVAAGARSEYVDPVVALANAKPEYILKAALKCNIPYEEDPVANIVVGALHGEKETAFYKYVYDPAGKKGKLAALAKAWVEKMNQRDEIEPPGTHKPGGAAEETEAQPLE